MATLWYLFETPLYQELQKDE